MTPRTRRDKRALRACYLVLALFLFATWLSTQAKADPGPTIVSYVGNNGETVCRLIDEEPNVPEVEMLVEVLHGKGFTYFESGQIIGLSVITFCPANLPVVKAYVNKYQGGQVSAISPVYAA